MGHVPRSLPKNPNADDRSARRFRVLDDSEGKHATLWSYSCWGSWFGSCVHNAREASLPRHRIQLGCEVALYSKLEVKPEDGNQERQSQGHLETSTLDTSILTPKLREHVPERDGERLIFSPEEPAQRNEYFVPRDGIDVDVITADLTLYLGNDVLLRTGSFQVRYTST